MPAVALYHHEKINGEGYPEGLTGERIPLLSRILAVADVFDALTSQRDYPKYAGGEILDRGPIPLPNVIDIINREAGKSFDAAVVEAFLRILPQALMRFRGTHFQNEYVDSALGRPAPELLPGALSG